MLAALGTLIAGERRDWVQTVLIGLDHPAQLAEALAPLADRTVNSLVQIADSPGASPASHRAGAIHLHAPHAHTVPIPHKRFQPPESRLAFFLGVRFRVVCEKQRSRQAE